MFQHSFGVRQAPGSPGDASAEARRGSNRLASVLLLTVCFLAPATLRAQGWIEPPVDRGQDSRVEKTRSRVTVRVEGRVAHVEVNEWFRNHGRRPAEGDYLYPLPRDAAFASFSLYQGEEELRGETMDAEKAREIYEEIVRRLKDPALLELAGQGLLRARVFPIGPGETRRVTLRYERLLPRVGDALQFAYAAPVPTGPGGSLRPHLNGAPWGAPLELVLTAVNGHEYLDPFSPTHPVEVKREGDVLRVTPRGDVRGDISVLLPLARDRVGIAVVSHRLAGEDGYFMLTLSPGDADAAPVPRDVTLVLDVSGSMSGEKIDQARSALQGLLATLSSRDRFRLVAFSSAVRPHRLGWSGADEEALEDARRWIDQLEADGGTHVAAALEEAFRLESPGDRLPVVIFLTDGIPSVGETDPKRIASHLEGRRARARLFAFGIGYDVNTGLLDGLTAAGRGTTQYVEPGESVERSLGLLSRKISHPVLADLELVGAPVSVSQLYPDVLPDLFAGEDLVVFGRYESGSGNAEGELVLRGRRRGVAEEFATRVIFPESSEGNRFLPRLWASRKLGFLSRALALDGEDPEIVEEIRRTALRYGLVSEYTAYLVREPLAVPARRGGDPRSTPSPAEALRDAAVQLAATAGGEGKAAVDMAERSRVRREMASVAEVEEFDRARVDELLGQGAGPGAARSVAGRLFRLREGVWVDQLHVPEREVAEVALYSRAYFDILRVLPELVPAVRSFEDVLVGGERVSVRFTERGTEELSDRQLQRLVLDFRGL